MRNTQKCMTWAAAIAFGSALQGCSASSEENANQLALDGAVIKWHAAHVADYVYVYQHECYCDPSRVRVVVQGGAAALATKADGSVVDDSQTVDDQLAYIKHALDSPADEFSAAYDDQYGYPKSVSIDRSKNVSDDEVGILVLCFAPSGGPSACPLAPSMTQ